MLIVQLVHFLVEEDAEEDAAQKEEKVKKERVEKVENVKEVADAKEDVKFINYIKKYN